MDKRSIITAGGFHFKLLLRILRKVGAALQLLPPIFFCEISIFFGGATSTTSLRCDFQKSEILFLIVQLLSPYKDFQRRSHFFMKKASAQAEMTL